MKLIQCSWCNYRFYQVYNEDTCSTKCKMEREDLADYLDGFLDTPPISENMCQEIFDGIVDDVRRGRRRE